MRKLILLVGALFAGCASGPTPPKQPDGPLYFANARERGFVPVETGNFAPVASSGRQQRTAVPVLAPRSVSPTPVVPSRTVFTPAQQTSPVQPAVRQPVPTQQVVASAAPPVRAVPRVTYLYMLGAGGGSQCPSLVRVPIQHTVEEQQHEVETLERLFSSRGDKERGIHTALEPVGGGIEVQGGVATLNLTAPPWRPDDKKCKSGLRQLEKTLASTGLKRAIIRVGGAPWERVTAQQ